MSQMSVRVSTEQFRWHTRKSQSWQQPIRTLHELHGPKGRRMEVGAGLSLGQRDAVFWPLVQSTCSVSRSKSSFCNPVCLQRLYDEQKQWKMIWKMGTHAVLISGARGPVSVVGGLCRDTQCNVPKHVSSGMGAHCRLLPLDEVCALVWQGARCALRKCLELGR